MNATQRLRMATQWKGRGLKNAYSNPNVRPQTELIKQLLKAQNFTMAQIGQALGINSTRISQWVRGEEEPDFDRDDISGKLLLGPNGRRVTVPKYTRRRFKNEDYLYGKTKFVNIEILAFIIGVHPSVLIRSLEEPILTAALSTFETTPGAGFLISDQYRISANKLLNQRNLHSHREISTALRVRKLSEFWTLIAWAEACDGLIFRLPASKVALLTVGLDISVEAITESPGEMIYRMLEPFCLKSEVELKPAALLLPTVDNINDIDAAKLSLSPPRYYRAPAQAMTGGEEAFAFWERTYPGAIAILLKEINQNHGYQSSRCALTRTRQRLLSQLGSDQPVSS